MKKSFPASFFAIMVSLVAFQIDLSAAQHQSPNSETTKSVNSSAIAETNQQANFKTAIITYQYKGGQQGVETVYLDLANNRIAQEGEVSAKISSERPAMTKKIHNIYEGTNFYEFVKTKEGDQAIKYTRSKDAREILFREKKIIDDYQYAGEAKVLGKKLKVYKSVVELTGFWNGIELKKKVVNHPFGERFNFTKEAVNIQLDVPIPPAKFQVPAGTKILTEEEAMKKIQNAMQTLGKKTGRQCPLQ